MSEAGTKARILLVDDDERNLLALSEVLTPVAEVVCCASGRHALRELLRGEFAVILLDVFMPDLDGYETAALVRERRQTAHIPIIFLSAVNKETEHLMRGYEMGAVDYVFKPVDPIVLKSKVSVFVDLFDMRRQLEESERRQATILRSLPIAIYEATEGPGGRLRRQFVGGDLPHLLLSDPDTASDESDWHDWIHPEDRPRFARPCDEDEESVTIEYRWVGRDGSRKHLLDQRVSTGARDGQRRWAGTLLDITDRKALEAQLVHVGKLDALGQLTGGVAHDFNNLLAAILSGLSLLERRLELGPSESRIVGQMRHAATHGADLVRRMMAFARQQDLTPVSIEPAELVDSVAGLVNHTLGGLVSLSWTPPENGINLFVDRSQLELALMNLIINARDAMPQGGDIKVSMRAVDAGPGAQPMLAIRVSDTGCGMPQEVLAKVTEPFFTTKAAGKGTGLGLSMVAGFVHQSGGSMQIDSVVGEGTAIELILPATHGEAATASPAAQADLSWLAGMRIYLIDDDEAVRTLLSEQLRDIGALVEEFPSGDAAIVALEGGARKPDYALCDFAMPGLNGEETLVRLSEISPSTRVSLMTGNADDERLSGGARFSLLRKPLGLEALAEALHREPTSPRAFLPDGAAELAAVGADAPTGR